jgi:hypothetical protein
VATERAVQTVGATIAVGGSDSGEINLAGASLLRVMVPTGTEGAALMFLLSSSPGGTFRPAYDRYGARLELPFTANSWVLVPLGELAGAQYLKVRTTDGSGSAANQSGADAALELVALLP